MQMGCNGKWLVFSLTILSVSVNAAESPNELAGALKSLENIRLELQKQGFKTELTNFDFTTSADAQAREAALADTGPNRTSARAVNNPFEHPNLMESTGDDKAIVVWRQDSLRRQTPSWPEASYEVTWNEYAEAINEKQPQ